MYRKKVKKETRKGNGKGKIRAYIASVLVMVVCGCVLMGCNGKTEEQLPEGEAVSNGQMPAGGGKIGRAHV